MNRLLLTLAAGVAAIAAVAPGAALRPMGRILRWVKRAPAG